MKKRDSNRRMLGPGVVRRRRPGGGDVLVVEPRGGPVEGRQPELDTTLGRGRPAPGKRVSQCTVPAGVAIVHDLVLAKRERPRRWNVLVRGVRARSWTVLERVSRARFTALLRGTELRVGGPERKAEGAEVAEVVWRFSLRNVPAPRSRDLLVRFVVELEP